MRADNVIHARMLQWLYCSTACPYHMRPPCRYPTVSMLTRKHNNVAVLTGLLLPLCSARRLTVAIGLLHGVPSIGVCGHCDVTTVVHTSASWCARPFDRSSDLLTRERRSHESANVVQRIAEKVLRIVNISLESNIITRVEQFDEILGEFMDQPSWRCAEFHITFGRLLAGPTRDLGRHLINLKYNGHSQIGKAATSRARLDHS